MSKSWRYTPLSFDILNLRVEKILEGRDANRALFLFGQVPEVCGAGVVESG
jgi:hypothetical protein